MRTGNYVFDQDLAIAISEKVAAALLILVVTWIVARAAKWAFAKLVETVKIFRQKTATGESIGTSLGKIVSLLIWLFGLLAVLQVLNLGGVMEPVQTLLNNVMGFIPKLIGAGLVFFIGTLVARIVRDIVVTSLQTVSFDKWVNRGGAEALTGNSQISKTIGVIVYVLIIVPIAILALDALGLDSVSEPASNMLALILHAIPRIVGAALLLGIGYLVSRFAVQILKEVLPGLGADRAFGATELLPAGTTVTSVVSRVAQLAIILFFAIAATRLLNFPELTAILDRVLDLGARVVFGATVIIAGFLIARLLAKLIGGAGETALAANIVKWATIILFTFMGLQFMGVGEDIVRLAFAALVVGGAVAGALAFGLGGRDWAARQLERLDKACDEKSGKDGPLN